MWIFCLGLKGFFILKCIVVFGISCINFWVFFGDIVFGLKFDLVWIMVIVNWGEILYFGVNFNIIFMILWCFGKILGMLLLWLLLLRRYLGVLLIGFLIWCNMCWESVLFCLVVIVKKYVVIVLFWVIFWLLVYI